MGVGDSPKPSNTNSPVSSLSPGERQFLLAVAGGCNRWVGLVRRDVTTKTVRSLEAIAFIDATCANYNYDVCGTGYGQITGSGYGEDYTGDHIGRGYGDGYSSGSGDGLGGLSVDVAVYIARCGWVGHHQAKQIVVSLYEQITKSVMK